MIEEIKHLFGFCGEPHPSILTFLFGMVPGMTYIKYKLKKIKK